MGGAYHTLVCGAELDGHNGSIDRTPESLAISHHSDYTAAAAAFASAYREGHPFEVVLIGATPAHRDPAPAIDEMLALDPLITIVLVEPIVGPPSD